MSENTTEKKQYPDGFPDDFEQLIRADGASENELTYYRVSRSGLINREEFKSTYEDRLKNDAPGHNRDVYMSTAKELDIGDYSTSGYEKIKDAKKHLKLVKKHETGPIIMEGKTDPKFGLSMRTRDSKTRHCKNSHIDWWIYEGGCPEVLFSRWEGE